MNFSDYQAAVAEFPLGYLKNDTSAFLLLLFLLFGMLPLQEVYTWAGKLESMI
jgi:hypothetical protein